MYFGNAAPGCPAGTKVPKEFYLIFFYPRSKERSKVNFLSPLLVAWPEVFGGLYEFQSLSLFFATDSQIYT